MHPIETCGGELAAQRHKERLSLRPCLRGQAGNDGRRRMVGSAGGKDGPMSGTGQLLWFKPRRAQDVLKCSARNDPPAVDRYTCVSAGIIPVPKNQMAALLSVFHDPQAPERAAQLGSAQPREGDGPTSTSATLSTCPGAGRPCSRRYSKVRRIAAFTFSIASPWVRPPLVQPGNAGT
jgi:hypothetical protein